MDRKAKGTKLHEAKAKSELGWNYLSVNTVKALPLVQNLTVTTVTHDHS